MKSKIRRVIEKWVQLGPGRRMEWQPTYVGHGTVFIYPARGSTEADHYLVARVIHVTPKHRYVNWVCSCRGFWYSAADECRHIKTIREKWDEEEGKLAS